MKTNKDELLINVIFIIYVCIYLLSISLYGMGNSQANIRFYYLIFAIVINLIFLVGKKGILNKKTKSNKLLYLVLVSILFLIISYIKAKSVGYQLAFRTLVQISFILLPAIYSYCIINSISMKSIIKMMSITLATTIIIYFSEKNHTFFSFFSLKNWMSINVVQFTSFTESGLCSEAFLQLYLFFIVANESIKNNKLLSICKHTSFIFTILCFKRLAILFLFVTIIFKKIIKITSSFKKEHSIAFSMFFTVSTIIYTKFVCGELLTNIDVYKFTTGRNYIMLLWSKTNYFSYGYGTSLLVINRYLEMDLVQIYMELGIIALFMFCYCFSKILNKKIFSYYILFYSFLNLLFSSSLPSSLTWIIMLITISCLSTNKLNEELIQE